MRLAVLRWLLARSICHSIEVAKPAATESSGIPDALAGQKASWHKHTGSPAVWSLVALGRRENATHPPTHATCGGPVCFNGAGEGRVRVSGPAGRTGQVCGRAPAAPSGRRRHRPGGGRGRKQPARVTGREGRGVARGLGDEGQERWRPILKPSHMTRGWRPRALTGDAVGIALASRTLSCSHRELGR